MHRFIIIFMLFFQSSEALNIGIIGDSNSVQCGQEPWNHWTYFVSKELAHDGIDNRIINYSVGNTNLSTLMPRLQLMVKEDRPDIVIINLGVVDALYMRKCDDVLKDFINALDLLESQNIPYIVGSVNAAAFWWIPLWYGVQFVDMYKTLIDIFPKIKYVHFITHERTSDSDYHANDCIHYNLKGHREIANDMKKMIMKAVADK